MSLDTTITNEEEAVVAPQWVTASGKPATIEPGTLQVSVLSGNGTVSIDTDNPEAFVVRSADNDEGDTVVQGSGDADRGAGIQPVTFQFVAHVTAAQAQGVADFSVSKRAKSPIPTP